MRLSNVLEGKRGPRPLKDTEVQFRRFNDFTPKEKKQAKLRFSKRTYEQPPSHQSSRYNLKATIPAHILSEIEQIVLAHPTDVFDVRERGGLYLRHGLGRMFEAHLSDRSKRELDQIYRAVIDETAPQFWNNDAHGNWRDVPTAEEIRTHAYTAIADIFKMRWRKQIRGNFTSAVDRQKLYAKLKQRVKHLEYEVLNGSATTEQIQKALKALE